MSTPTMEDVIAEERDKWPDGFNAQQDDITKNDITDFIVHKIRMYTAFNAKDDTLWETFTDDFSTFNIESFKSCNQFVTRNLRDFLRQQGVWIQKKRGQHTSNALFACVREEEPSRWTELEVNDSIQKGEKFNSNQIDMILKRASQSTTRLPTPQQPVPQMLTSLDPQVPTPLTPLHRTNDLHSPTPYESRPQDYVKELTNLAKLYTDENRYTGQNDNFDLKLTMFHSLCDRAGVSYEAKTKAYPTMLRGQALDHYYINCNNIGHTTSFNDLCNSTRNYFEGPEYRRSCLIKWNEATLRTTMSNNVGKSTIDCLQLLIVELRHLQHGLDQSLRTDVTLHNKLILACRDLPACQYACYRPSETLSGLMNDLQSSIVTYEKAHRVNNDQFHTNTDTDAFFTDRRFQRQQYQPRPADTRPSRSVRPKRCFVCQKEGCWSTKHTQSERDESRKRFQQRLGQRFNKHTRQYIAEYEGTENDDSYDMNELIDTLIIDTEDSYAQEQDFDQAENFMTSLANHSFVHSLVRTTPIDTDQPDPFAYVTAATRYTSDRFYGVMIDTGASKRSTAGWGQFQAYQKTYGTTIDATTAGAVNVQFGIGSVSSVGSILVRIPIGTVEFHVVKADTPFLLCLADMDTLGAYYNNLENKLVTRTKSLPVYRQFGHPFLLWGTSFQSYVTTSFNQNPCYLTTVELRRLHRRFGHPSVERLYKILERSGHDTNKATLDRLTKFCSHCQKHGKSPGRFKFVVRDDQDSDFNHSIFVDIMYIDGSPVLHIIDEATRFQAARWLQNISAKHTWDMLRHCWIDTYLGPPDCIVHDAGKNFVSKEFKQHAITMSVSTKSVPVEAHWSIGLVERAHPILRRAFHIITEELQGSDTTKEMNLQMAVKAVNDTAGPDGLVPTLLVFGAYPRMTATDPPAPSISQRAIAVRKAMNEITKIRAKMQVNNALNQRNGPSTDAIHDLPLNSDVLVWREGNVGHSGKWTGPFKLIGVTDETCRIQLPHGPTDFRTTVVKPYLTDPEPYESDKPIHEPTTEPVHEPITEDCESIPEDREQTQEPRRNAVRSRRLPARFRQHAADISVFLQDDCLQFSYSYEDSRQMELNGLLEKKVFDIVGLDTVPPGARIFNLRFVDEVKHAGTDRAFEKSRLVVQAYNDQNKNLVLTQSPTIQRVSQRLLLILSTILQKEKSAHLYLRDISQAYVQSSTRLIRDFFVRPPQELGLEPGMILKVVKPLYGVPEAGNHWFHTYHRHHLEKLHMHESTYDSCLLYTNTKGFGIVGLQTDDTLFLADDTFADSEESNLKEAKLLAKDREQLTYDTPIKFNGSQIKLESDDSISLTQEQQCQNLRLVALKSIDLTNTRGIARQAVTPKDQYIAQRARGAYIASVCQPEAAFDLSYAAQVVNPKAENAKQLNKRLKWQIDNSTRGLRFVRLDKDSLKLVVFTDSSFANNHDCSSQIGFVIVLADGSNKANIVHWSSIKCKRVTRSVLASELYGMTHGFDLGSTIKSTIERILQMDVLPLVLCTDSKSLYDCLIKLGTTQEKRLMVDLMCLRQSYERREIAEIKWIDGDNNPADAMTKSKPCQALRDLIDTNTIKLDVTEWVERG